MNKFNGFPEIGQLVVIKDDYQCDKIHRMFIGTIIDVTLNEDVCDEPFYDYTIEFNEPCKIIGWNRIVEPFAIWEIEPHE